MVEDGDMSSNITSEVVDIKYMDNIGIHAVFTGTPDGEIFIDVSNDDGSNWTTLSFDSDILVSAAGDHNINVNQCPFQKIRLRYVASSGSGTLNATLMAKRLGG